MKFKAWRTVSQPPSDPCSPLGGNCAPCKQQDDTHLTEIELKGKSSLMIVRPKWS